MSPRTPPSTFSPAGSPPAGLYFWGRGARCRQHAASISVLLQKPIKLGNLPFARCIALIGPIHFCRSTIAPRPSSRTTWNEFLPISMPITAIALCAVAAIGILLVLAPPASLSLAGQEHGRTIPLAVVRAIHRPRCSPAPTRWSNEKARVHLMSRAVRYPTGSVRVSSNTAAVRAPPMTAAVSRLMRRFRRSGVPVRSGV